MPRVSLHREPSGALSPRTIIVVGVANLFADGLSMGVGNYLSIRSHESARAAIDLPEEASPARHGAMTFAAFAGRGRGAPPAVRAGRRQRNRETIAADP